MPRPSQTEVHQWQPRGCRPSALGRRRRGCTLHTPQFLRNITSLLWYKPDPVADPVFPPEPSRGDPTAKESPTHPVETLMREMLKAQVMACFHEPFSVPPEQRTRALTKAFDSIVELIWKTAQGVHGHIEDFNDEELAAEVDRRRLAREGS